MNAYVMGIPPVAGFLFVSVALAAHRYCMVGLTPVVLTANVQNGAPVLGQQYAMADSKPQLCRWGGGEYVSMTRHWH